MPKIPFWIFLIIAVLYFSATRVDIMDIDASQYAEMSREMIHRGNYLQLFDHAKDYLDKPPFLFWVSALSMKIFGANNFGYRLPSILFALFALYATYRLAKLLYDENTGRVAALVLGVCQGVFLMTNDVRTDTILMAWVIAAIWCIKECELKRRWQYVLAGTLAIACGLMTKGPIALMVPVFAMGSDWVLKRKWKQIFNPWHLLDAAIIAALLIPMSIGLYQQFDLHPEKLIDGKHGTSGLRFFFWSQSFGRITGESDWDNGADISFLFVNMLWAFLPWIFLFLAALIINIKDLIQQKFKLLPGQEWVTTGGFILAYLALGMSHYQLPHYIFVVFPLASIMVAKLLHDFLVGKYPKLYRFFTGLQTIVAGLLLVGVLLILTIVFPAGWIGFLLWGIAVVIWFAFAIRKKWKTKIIWISVAGMILTNAFLTNYFYYNLLHYEVGTHIGRYIRQENISPTAFASWRIEDPLDVMDFYAQQQTVHYEDGLQSIPNNCKFLLTGKPGIDRLDSLHTSYRVIKQGGFFKVSELTPEFLSNTNRPKALKQYYLLQLH